MDVREEDEDRILDSLEELEANGVGDDEIEGAVLDSLISRREKASVKSSLDKIEPKTEDQIETVVEEVNGSSSLQQSRRRSPSSGWAR